MVLEEALNLSCKRGCGYTADPQSINCEHFTRIAFFQGLVDSCGHEQAVQIRTTKGTGGCLHTRKFYFVHELASLRINSDHHSPMAHRYPEHTFRIDRHSIRRASKIYFFGINDDLLFSDSAGSSLGSRTSYRFANLIRYVNATK